MRRALKRYHDHFRGTLDNTTHPKWSRSLNRLRKTYSTHKDKIPTLIEHGEHFEDDTAKAERFNFRYCHPRLDPHNMPYAPMPEMDLNNIPTVPASIYPANDVQRACYVPNPRLVCEELFGRELTALNSDFTVAEVTNTLKTFSCASMACA